SRPGAGAGWRSRGELRCAVPRGDLAEGGEVAREPLPALPGQGEPGAGPVLDVTLVHLHVARLLERAHLLRKNRVADLDVVADEAELGAFGGGEQGHDGKSNRVAQKVIQVVARVPHRLRPKRIAPTNTGTTASTALRTKCKLLTRWGRLFANQPEWKLPCKTASPHRIQTSNTAAKSRFPPRV